MEMRLLVLGAGGHGRVVADAAFEAGYRDICFLDARREADLSPMPFRIVGGFDDLAAMRGSFETAFVAIGSNALRFELHQKLLALGFSVPVIKHPTAAVSSFASLSPGVFVAAQVAVNCGAEIGAAAILNTSCSIDHDCRIGEAAHISPGASLAGNVRVGARSWLGAGSSVKPGVEIGEDVVVGLGSAVIRDIPSARTVVGVPAHEMIKKVVD